MMYGYPNNTGETWHPWQQRWQPTAPPNWTFDWTANMWMTCPKRSKLVQWGSIYCPSCGEKMIDEIMERDKLEQILDKLDEILKELKKE